MRKPTREESRVMRARRLAKPLLREATSTPKPPRKGPTGWVNPMLALIEAWRAVEIARKAVEEDAEFSRGDLEPYVKRLADAARHFIAAAVPQEDDYITAMSSPRLILIELTRIVDKANEVADNHPLFAETLADDSLYPHKMRLFVACREFTHR